MRVAGAGTNLLYLQGVGAVGVGSNIAEYYNNIQTGLADCAVVWAEAAVAYSMYEVAPYFIKLDLGAVSSFALTVNSRTWDRLPEEVREVMSEVAVAYREELVAYVTEAAAGALEAYAERGEVIEFGQEQREAWAASLNNIAREWADAADAQGKPGTEVLDRYMAIMRENGQLVGRAWDE